MTLAPDGGAASHAGAVPGQTGFDAARRRVLLADDTPLLRRTLRHRLEGTGRYTVVAEAADGLQAVAAARAHAPDVVILDLSMPTMDGLQATPAIRSVCPDVRIVVFSGFPAAQMEALARDAGADGYVEKGTPVRDLIELVDRLCRPAPPRP